MPHCLAGWVAMTMCQKIMLWNAGVIGGEREEAWKRRQGREGSYWSVKNCCVSSLAMLPAGNASS